MIYIGQYKGKQVYHEEPFVAKACNQTCNKLQDVATEGHIDKNYSCPKCGTKWRGTFESCPSCGNEDVIVNIVSTTGFPELIKHGKWIRTGEDGYCSVCKCDMPMFRNDWEWEYTETPYCPNCGAKMDLEKNDG